MKHKFNIGNYVLNPNTNEAEKLTLEKLADYETKLVVRQPIPLNSIQSIKFWMEKFGFETFENHDKMFVYEWHSDNAYLYVNKDGSLYFEYMHNHVSKSIVFDYVHEVQSLFQSLFGIVLD